MKKVCGHFVRMKQAKQLHAPLASAYVAARIVQCTQKEAADGKISFTLELDYSFNGKRKSYVANDCSKYISKAAFSPEERQLWLRGCAERGISSQELEDSFQVQHFNNLLHHLYFK